MVKQKCWKNFQQFSNKHYKTWIECMNSYVMTLKCKHYVDLRKQQNLLFINTICCKFSIFPPLVSPSLNQHSPKPKSEHNGRRQRDTGETLQLCLLDRKWECSIIWSCPTLQPMAPLKELLKCKESREITRVFSFSFSILMSSLGLLWGMQSNNRKINQEWKPPGAKL